jgi:hypothetical protein
LQAQARADEGAIFVPVPTRGLVFRAQEGGHAIARVRSDVAGGVIEVFDAHERVAIRLRATVNGGAIEVGRTSTLAAPSLTVGSYEDPGY